MKPFVRLNQIVFDTNVFYDTDKRQSDLSAGGGPGLRLSLPVRAVTIYGEGATDYTWFARTESQRRFGGTAGGGFDWRAGAFELGASQIYGRTFRRPSVEVDERIQEDTVTTRAYLDLGLGVRFRVTPRFDANRRQVALGTRYLGADLGRSLTQDTYRGELELSYGLTPKTRLLVIGDQQWDRFPQDETRDSDSNRAGIGFSITSQTRLDGRAVGGVRQVRPRAASRGASRKAPWAEARLTWHLGAKTRISGDYRLDTYYSAFDTLQGLPTYLSHTAELRLYRRLVGRIEIELFGRLRTVRSDAAVVIRRESEDVAIRRDDRFYETGADLGYAFRNNLRIGVMASYAKRQTRFRDFGIDGLLMGLTIRYNP